ncbi:MAG: sigma 54-interacting transcriptional regulator [Candidatus Aminicenantes bacterium]|nr:sigma 54-interacting transcriptional regulator [Candidatus Aminicenantes bacterium]
MDRCVHRFDTAARSGVNASGGSKISAHNFEELATLHAVARILAQPGDLRDQIEQALREMSDRLGMKRGMVSLIDHETGEAWLDVAQGINIKGANVTYKPGEGITGKVAQTGRPMACANLGSEPHFLDRTGARRALNRSELSFLCVPIVYDGHVIGVLSADKASRKVENLDRDLAMISSIAELLAKEVHNRRIEEENRRLRHILGRSKAPSQEIVGHSVVMQNLFGMIAQVADSNTTVLINGETGTGKELIASAIHRNSPRLRGPLVQVNCAAIPDTLLESELFGHEKGAFTGALHQRRGRFEEANGGTIFLDEVGELSAAAQAKLLRVLQEKQFQPLGSSRTVRVDVRVIAATNRNLEQDLSSGRFRADLFYRLNVFPLFLPPLRERGTDIILLADHFVQKYTREMGKPAKRISPAVSAILMAYPWPGNVRELENCIERAILLTPGDVIEPAHLPPSLQIRLKDAEQKDQGKLNTFVKAQERELIVNALKETHGNQTRAAQILGTTKRIIQYRIRKMGIDPRTYRGKSGGDRQTDESEG